MIEHIDISSVHTVIDDKLHKYILKKIGGLDKYMPKAKRADVRAEVRMSEVKADDGKRFHCAIQMLIPGEPLRAEEPATNPFSAVDIAEANLKHQLGGKARLRRRL